MATRATVSATFATLAAAEAAVTSLLQTRFHARDVILTKGLQERSYVVTVAANERFGEAEDVLRQHAPTHWRMSIHDEEKAAGTVNGSLLHIAPEADRLEQDAPWLAAVSEATSPRPTHFVAEADWIEQGQEVYPIAIESQGQRTLDALVRKADHAEQLAIAYRALPNPDEE